MSEQKVVKSKWLLDMVSDKPIEDGAVIFQDGKIKLSGHYEKIKGKIPVSYTHLTLPTIYSV